MSNSFTVTAAAKPQSCVITGNPVDGIFVYGPFPSHEEAIEWAQVEQEGQDWWVTDLQSPSEVETE